ncbi:hypothetical protein K8T06_06485 [bacterium]|nr:hypothetical protein [bacterium]
MILLKYYPILIPSDSDGHSNLFRASLFTATLTFCLLFSGCATPISIVTNGPALNTSLLPEPVPYRVYTPPNWNGHQPLPLIIFLHDRGDHCTDLETSNLIQHMYNLVQAGDMSPFILAAPENKDGFWLDYYDQTHFYAKFLVQDFIPKLQADYPLINGPAGLHLTGVGTGASGAVALAYAHPGMFGSVGSIDGCFFDDVATSTQIDKNIFYDLRKIFGPSTDKNAMMTHNVYHRINSRKSIGITRFVIGAGSFSSWDITETNELFRQHLSKYNIPYDYVIYHGTTKWVSRQNIVPAFIGLQLRNRRNYGEVNGMPYQVLKFQ